jgi:hypothetical protein
MPPLSKERRMHCPVVDWSEVIVAVIVVTARDRVQSS